MARTRSIKPEFWNDEKLATISRDARLTFAGMWTASDDYGVVKGSSVWLKSQIFPYEDIRPSVFEKWISELRELNRIIPFDVKGEQYYFIPNFLKHQKIDHPSKARNPEPPKDIRERLAKGSRNNRFETETETETEYKQKQKQKQRQTPECLLNLKSLTIEKSYFEKLCKEFPTVDHQEELKCADLYREGKPKKGKRNDHLFLRNWFKNSIKFKEKGNEKGNPELSKYDNL